MVGKIEECAFGTKTPWVATNGLAVTPQVKPPVG